MAPSEKGNFSANIGDDVIREALQSVEKRGVAGEDGEALDIEKTPPAGTDVPGGGEEQTQAEYQVPAELLAEAKTQVGRAPAPPQASAENKEIEDLKAQLDFSMAKGRELMEKVRDEHERALRASADLENFKKRANKEKEEVQKFGSERLLKDFLPVVDNLDRALEHAKSATDFESLKKGVEMTRKLFEDTLGKHGVKSFRAVGQMFDPHLHEAMQQLETPGVPPNQVVMEVLRGYMLNDRLVRPALVAIAKAPADAPAPSTSNEPSATPEATGEKN